LELGSLLHQESLLRVSLPVSDQETKVLSLDFPSVWGDLVSLSGASGGQAGSVVKRLESFSVSTTTATEEDSRKVEFQFCSPTYAGSFSVNGVGCDSISALPSGGALDETRPDVGQVIEFLQSLGKESHSHNHHDDTEVLEDPVLLN